MLIDNKNKDQEDNNRDTSSVATLEKPKVKKPPLYRVILLNDDYTPMEFVVYVLQIFFGFDGDKAQQIMLAVHTHGKGVCGIFTREVAETKSAQVNNFAKENDLFVIKSGALPNEKMDEAKIKALASLPSREELLAKLMGTMQAPIAKFVRTLNEVPTKFVRGLAAVRDQKEVQA